ncbi:SCO family protein [Photobacterium sp. SDRW27]|uniref:SCO family protein n=1 Tax=Photobacterium obscurum TaxID=2829490 RepID=UPI002244C2E0|nr:SCO family protein [Photobacterium obscurum]MCW8328382.1 SCO family protein [Photobacterium obscurum]
MRIVKFVFGVLLLLLINLPVMAAPLTFSLNEANLGTVTEKNWPGHHLLIGIGYTSCPDVCPTTVMDMASTIRKLGNKADQITPIFISVDPNRDTPESLDSYVKYFGPKMIGLVGSDEQTSQVVRALKGTYGYSLDGKPVYPPLPKQYEVYHSAYVYFYGPDRELVDVFGYGTGSEQMAKIIAEQLQ